MSDVAEKLFKSYFPDWLGNLKGFEKYMGINMKEILDSGNKEMIEALKKISYEYYINNCDIENVVPKPAPIQNNIVKELIKEDWEEISKEMKEAGLLEIEPWDKFIEKIYKKFPGLENEIFILWTNKFHIYSFLPKDKESQEEKKSEIRGLSKYDMDLLEKMTKLDHLPISIFVNGPSPRPNTIKEHQTTGYRRQFIYLLSKLIQNLPKSERKILIFIPESDSMFGSNEHPFDYTAQVTFEKIGRREADINIYWIPRYDEFLPGNTTAIEMALPNEGTKMELVYYGCRKRIQQYMYSRSYRGAYSINTHTNNIHYFFDSLLVFVSELQDC